MLRFASPLAVNASSACSAFLMGKTATSSDDGSGPPGRTSLDVLVALQGQCRYRNEHSPKRLDNPRRIPSPAARLLIQRIQSQPLRATVLLAVLGREIHLALALPVVRVDLTRHDRQRLVLRRAHSLQRQQLATQQLVPGALQRRQQQCVSCR
ncbi:hypothetical protein VTK56DRAFT_3007 [Thermocarpiscus australiensis]